MLVYWLIVLAITIVVGVLVYHLFDCGSLIYFLINVGSGLIVNAVVLGVAFLPCFFEMSPIATYWLIVLGIADISCVLFTLNVLPENHLFCFFALNGWSIFVNAFIAGGIIYPCFFAEISALAIFWLVVLTVTFASMVAYYHLTSCDDVGAFFRNGGLYVVFGVPLLGAIVCPAIFWNWQIIAAAVGGVGFIISIILIFVLSNELSRQKTQNLFQTRKQEALEREDRKLRIKIQRLEKFAGQPVAKLGKDFPLENFENDYFNSCIMLDLEPSESYDEEQVEMRYIERSEEVLKGNKYFVGMDEDQLLLALEEALAFLNSRKSNIDDYLEKNNKEQIEQRFLEHLGKK